MRRPAKRQCWNSAAWVLLALASGCATEPAPRLIEGEEGLRELGLGRPSAADESKSNPASEPAYAAPALPPALAKTERRLLQTSARAAQDAAVEPDHASRDTEILHDPNGETIPAPAVIPTPGGDYLIDLPTSLRLADRVNPTINRMRSAVLEALAAQLAARILLVPSLNGGASYHGHNGAMEHPSGKILETSIQSLYLGAGAYVEQAGSPRIPGVNILTPLTDAIYEPLAAHQRVIASRFNVASTELDILGEVAILHLELMRCFALLEAHRISERQAYQIVQAVEEYAITGQGRQADADRARAEWRYRRADVIDAEQGIGIAAARLAQRLNLDPSVRLHPAGGPLAPLSLVALEAPAENLIQVGLQQHPELAARTADIAEARWHVKQEIGRPLLPTLWLGFDAGAFGGGSNLTPPLVGNFGGRTDFDVRLYWTFLNMGAGNMGLIRTRQAQEGEAVATRARAVNRVRDEIAASLAEARAARNLIDVARVELESSRNGFHEDLTRSFSNLGRPIEAINSLTLLAAARAHLIDAIVRYDQAQFRLWVAMGTPPPLVETSSPDQPPIPAYLIP